MEQLTSIREKFVKSLDELDNSLLDDAKKEQIKEYQSNGTSYT